MTTISPTVEAATAATTAATAAAAIASAQPTAAEALPWTCPFCSLLCDGFHLRTVPNLRLVDSDCPRARAGLAAFDPDPSGDHLAAATPMVDGAAVSLDVALDAAAARLRAARLPLFGGLSTDVDGMRGLYRLANLGGAIFDHAQGDAQMHSLRALQDRGQIFTTLAEIRNRADLIVCLGTDAVSSYPEFFRRCAPVEGAAAPRVVFLGAEVPSAPALTAFACESLMPGGDVFDVAAQLAAWVAGRHLAVTASAADGAQRDLAELAEAMRAARYCVVVWEPGRLPAHGALVAEAILRMVTTLNRSTRAGAFTLGGAEGAQTASAVMTWLSGVPLRSRVGPQGLTHDPLRFATARVLARREVDLVVWVACLLPTLQPPDAGLPRVVLGHPGLAAVSARPDTVFVPVATPGVNAGGHLFRADSVVALPLDKVRDDGLPTVGEVARALAARLAPAEGAQ